MTKNWLILGALTFGVGFSISLILDKDIKRAALTGLITLPATAAGVSVMEYRRKQQLSDTLSRLQARVEELEKQEAGLNQSLSRLETQTEDLKQQQIALEQLLATAITDKKQVEQALAARQTELDQLQTQVTVQQNHKQELEQALVTLKIQKQQLEQESCHLQTHLQKLKNQQTTLNHSLAAISDEKQQVEVYLGSLKTELNQLQAQVSEQQQLLSILGQEQMELEAHQSQLTAESQRLQTSTQELRQQESILNQSFAAITAQKQQAENELNLYRTQSRQLQNQIVAQETRRAELSQNLAALEQQKHQLETDSSNLQLQIYTLEQQSAQLRQPLTTITAQKQQAQDRLSALETELSQLQTQVFIQQQQKEQLTQELAALALQKDQLVEELRQLQAQIQAKKSHQPAAAQERSILPPTPSRQRSSRNLQKQRESLDYNLMNSKYTKQVWEEKILPHWSHRQRPVGHRFLGSIRVQRPASEQLLDILGQNLKQLDRVTYNSLNDQFYESEQNWLKVLTFTLSEYAYYYSSERFWQGFCERLDINHNQGVENALRQVVDEGIDLLGLVRAKGGYKYVSTMWLQSGVPEQNLGHFAQLVQEIADEYGWWELAHTSAEDLSQVLLSFCQEKHPQWGTLLHFLQASYSEQEDAEPISGQLVQGIAIVAQELERQKVSPQALQDGNQREELLGNYYLPQNFFLRNWNALIQVLTPKAGSGQSQGVVSRRSKPLFLSLDVADSLNTQLVLPEQVLWKPEWRNLRETYCKIPEANWEEVIPKTGDLQVPELVIDVNQASEDWSCQLLDHNRQPLLKWHYEGITSELPCLVFESLTGNHLPLHFSNPTIIGVEEVICFTPKDIQPQFSNGIEITDSCIPSSIRGWRGQQVRLATPESSIVLILPETGQSQLINWKLAADEQPVLRGLRLKGKKPIYLEAPTFWYPPLHQAITLNILIENITEKTIVARTLETLSPNNLWFTISLNQWITKPDCYEAHFWFEQQRWSYKFEVQSKYQMTGLTEFNRLTISSSYGFSATDLPIKYDVPEKFWSESIKIDGLWPLEEIIVLLSNVDEKIPYRLAANASGSLTIYLPALYDLLPQSNWYALDYQRSGLEPQRLLEMDRASQAVSWNWTSQFIQIFGLHSAKLYILSCWNLLLPDTKPVEIKISLVTEGTAATTVPLALPTGIYYIQLLSSQQLIQNLGWWCGCDRYDLPEQANENEALENYCYTVLGNSESTEDFLAAAKKLNLDFERQRIQAGILALENNHYYFPEWLSRDALLGKFKELLQLLNLPAVTSKQQSTSPPVTPIEPPLRLAVNGNWYMVYVRHKKRDLFLRCLEMAIEHKKLQDLILAVETPKDSVYEDIVLLNLANLKAARTHIQNINYCQKIEAKPLPSAHVSRMLGSK